MTYEFSLRVNQDNPLGLELLKRILVGWGIKEREIVELEQEPYKYLNIYLKTFSHSKILREKIREQKLKQVVIKIKRLVRREWLTKWKDEYKPFRISRNFDVVPYVYKDSYHSPREAVYLDTSLAFGSGLHPTTRFMAQFIDRLRGKFDTFLDIGTGSGILAIMALKCEAKKIKAIDLSVDVMKVTKRNLRKNGFSGKGVQCIDFLKLKKTRPFDYVAANLITQQLLEMRGKIISFVKKGKYLAVSGISLNNYPRFRAHFDRFPLKCLKVEKAEGWTAILYKRI